MNDNPSLRPVPKYMARLASGCQRLFQPMMPSHPKHIGPASHQMKDQRGNCRYRQPPAPKTRCPQRLVPRQRLDNQPVQEMCARRYALTNSHSPPNAPSVMPVMIPVTLVLTKERPASDHRSRRYRNRCAASTSSGVQSSRDLPYRLLLRPWLCIQFFRHSVTYVTYLSN